MRSSAYTFSMSQCLVFHDVDPANYAPVVQIDLSMGVIYFHRLVIIKL